MTKKQQYLSNVWIQYENLREAVDMYDRSGNRDLTFVNAYLVATISAIVSYIDTVWKPEHGNEPEAELFLGIKYANNMVKHSYELVSHVKEAGGLGFPVSFPLVIPKMKMVWSNQKLDAHHKEQVRAYEKLFAGRNILEPLQDVMNELCIVK